MKGYSLITKNKRKHFFYNIILIISDAEIRWNIATNTYDYRDDFFQY